MQTHGHTVGKHYFYCIFLGLVFGFSNQHPTLEHFLSMSGKNGFEARIVNYPFCIGSRQLPTVGLWVLELVCPDAQIHAYLHFYIKPWMHPHSTEREVGAHSFQLISNRKHWMWRAFIVTLPASGYYSVSFIAYFSHPTSICLNVEIVLCTWAIKTNNMGMFSCINRTGRGVWITCKWILKLINLFLCYCHRFLPFSIFTICGASLFAKNI